MVGTACPHHSFIFDKQPPNASYFYPHGTISCVIPRLLQILLRGALYTVVVGILGLVLPRLITGLYARARLDTPSGVENTHVAIVFGAGLWRDGSPTPVLRDRVETAAELYFSGKVKKILMSGDNRFVEYNEPGAMRDYALSLGVPEEDIVLDFAGRRTYDTCYRAQAVFGLGSAILVTQGYHLPRALYTCNILDIEATGVPADRRSYSRRSVIYWNLRELPATLIAFWDLYITQPLPVLGEPEPIFVQTDVSPDAIEETG
jgi:SanA protein